MKTAAVVGIFILVASSYLQANGAVYRGKIADCNNPPKGLRDGCQRFECESGWYTVSTCGVRSVLCPKGQVAERGYEDFTKPYPDCCARPYCRDL